MTWGNLSAAAIVALSDKDRVVSNSLSKRTPLFNSQQRASDKSNDHKNSNNHTISHLSFVCRYFVQNIGCTVKTTRAVSQGLGAGAIASANDGLQKTFGRTRPNDEPDGFPSGHSAEHLPL